MFITAKQFMDQINYERLQSIIQKMSNEIQDLKKSIGDLKRSNMCLGEMIMSHHNSLDWVIKILVELATKKECPCGQCQDQSDHENFPPSP